MEISYLLELPEQLRMHQGALSTRMSVLCQINQDSTPDAQTMDIPDLNPVSLRVFICPSVRHSLGFGLSPLVGVKN
jgi:hypothetical protein